MTDNYQQLLYDSILDEEHFTGATFSGRLRGAELVWKKLVIRPVLVQNRWHLQFSYFDETQNIVKNYAGDEAGQQLQAALDLPFRNFHLRLVDENIQINLTKKGKPMISRTRLETPNETELSHDRQKNTVLREGENILFLHALSMTAPDDTLKAGMQSKFRQINAFLGLLRDIGEIQQLDEPVRLVDFGCGSAFLTFAAYHYLEEMLGKQVHITGVDKKAHLIQKNSQIATDLGWRNIDFVEGLIADYETDTPAAITVALHACDTATDDAIARGILWNSRVILVAPCCHHHMQAQLEANPTPEPLGPMLRYGLLHERMGDIITDTFRALILKIFGYKVDMVEFVAPDHTPKNLLIRAVKTNDAISAERLADNRHLQEYQHLREYWGVTPYLQTLLDEQIFAR